jgi:hypothetical protein
VKVDNDLVPFGGSSIHTDTHALMPSSDCVARRIASATSNSRFGVMGSDSFFMAVLLSKRPEGITCASHAPGSRHKNAKRESLSCLQRKHGAKVRLS